MRTGFIGLLTAAFSIASVPASAQVRDAVYRGTMVCDKLPFSAGKSREAIEDTIVGGSVRYSRVVRLRSTAEPTREEGSGTRNGDNISLKGSWKGGNRQFEAKYDGTFVEHRPGTTATKPQAVPVTASSSGRCGRSCSATENSRKTVTKSQ